MDSEKIISLINQTRVQSGLLPLAKNEHLMTAALKKTAEMKDQNFFSHQNKIKQTITALVPKDYQYAVIGENLAFGFNNEKELVQAWLLSPTHRMNILDKEYLETGVNILPIEGKFLAAQVFAVQQKDFLQEKENQNIENFWGIPFGGAFSFFAVLAIIIPASILLILRRKKKSK